jgi:hypothetical protein
MTAPAIQEAKRIVARIRRRMDCIAYYCAGCRRSVVFREYEVCLNCRGEGENRSKDGNWNLRQYSQR